MLNRREIFQWLAALPFIGGLAKAKQISSHDGCYQAAWTVRFKCDPQEVSEIAELMVRNNDLLVNHRGLWRMHGETGPSSKYLWETRSSDGTITSKVAVTLVGRFPIDILLDNLTQQDRILFVEHLKFQTGKPSLFRYNATVGTLRDGSELSDKLSNPALDMTWCLAWDYRDFKMAEKATALMECHKRVGDFCVFPLVTSSGDYLPHCQSFLQHPIRISDLVSAMTKADRVAMLARLQAAQ